MAFWPLCWGCQHWHLAGFRRVAYTFLHCAHSPNLRLVLLLMEEIIAKLCWNEDKERTEEGRTEAMSERSQSVQYKSKYEQRGTMSSNVKTMQVEIAKIKHEDSVSSTNKRTTGTPISQSYACNPCNCATTPNAWTNHRAQYERCVSST